MNDQRVYAETQRKLGHNAIAEYWDALADEADGKHRDDLLSLYEAQWNETRQLIAKVIA